MSAQGKGGLSARSVSALGVSSQGVSFQRVVSAQRGVYPSMH